MNEKMSNTNFTNHETRARGCERAADLVAFLYGEALPEESASFSLHLNSCAVCRDELAAFGHVRELVGAQRADALSAAPSLDVDELISPVVVAPTRLPARGRSAVAALREFFTLSPRWLQAGAVAALLLFCGLAALTISRAEVRWDANGFAFKTGVHERVVVQEAPLPNGFTQEEVDSIVSREIEVARKQWQSELNSTQSVVAAGESPEATPRQEVVSISPPRAPRRKRSVPQPSRRQEFAVRNDEDELPRLSDLLGGVY